MAKISISLQVVLLAGLILASHGSHDVDSDVCQALDSFRQGILHVNDVQVDQAVAYIRPNFLQAIQCNEVLTAFDASSLLALLSVRPPREPAAVPSVVDVQVIRSVQQWLLLHPHEEATTQLALLDAISFVNIDPATPREAGAAPSKWLPMERLAEIVGEGQQQLTLSTSMILIAMLVVGSALLLKFISFSCVQPLASTAHRASISYCRS